MSGTRERKGSKTVSRGALRKEANKTSIEKKNMKTISEVPGKTTIMSSKEKSKEKSKEESKNEEKWSKIELSKMVINEESKPVRTNNDFNILRQLTDSE